MIYFADANRKVIRTRRSLVVAFMLFLILFVFGSQSSYARQLSSLVQLTVGNRKITVRAPQDWYINRQYDSEAFDLALTSPMGEIIVDFTSRTSLHGAYEDSKMPQWLAGRFANAWKVPLYRWDCSGGAVVQDTFRTGTIRNRYVVSGYGNDIEVAISAEGPPGSMTLDQIRPIAARLLASAVFVGPEPTPVFQGLKSEAHVKLIKSTIDPRTVIIDGKHVTVPEGWLPGDMFQPLSSKPGSDEHINVLDIATVKSDKQNSLFVTIQWVNSHTDPKIRHNILRHWTNGFRSQSTTGRKIVDLAVPAGEGTRYRKLTQRLPEEFMGKTDQTRLLYESSKVSVFGTAFTNGEKQSGMVQNAFEMIGKQIIRN